MIPELDIDPYCTAFLDNPYPAHAAMRDAGPVVHLPRYDIYAVARHDDIRAMLMDWGSYTSARGVGISDFAKDKPWRLPSLLLEADPPLHDRTRNLMDKILSPAALRALRQPFAAAADTLIDTLLVRGTFDAVRDLAEAYPLNVFPDAIGMPQENRRFLLPYGNMVFNSFGPRNALFEASVADAEPVFAWVQAQSKRQALSPNGFGAAIHAAAGEANISEAEAEVLVRSLLTAGVDTTVNGLCAAIDCLARFPTAFQQLRSNPSLARAAFEEAVRLESPIQTFFRTTTRDIAVGQETIPQDSKVLMFFGAANRDPRRWQHADEYDITRRNAAHVGFGTGIHACVGAILARLEGELVLAALARKVASIEIVGEPKRRYNNTLRGLASLPVRIVAA